MTNSTAAALMYGAYLLAAIAMTVAAHAREGLSGNVTLYGALAIVGALTALLAVIHFFLPSPRPAIFFGTFVGLVVLPWVVVYVTLGPGMFARQPSPPAQAMPAPAHGPTVADLTAGVAGAKRAQVSMFAAGGTIHEAHFADETSASEYLANQFGTIKRPSSNISGKEGMLLSETPAIFVRREGASAWIYNAPDRATLERMIQDAASAPPAARSAKPPAGASRDPFVERFGLGPMVGGLLFYMLFVSLVFLRLATWAAVQEPDPGAQPVPAPTLRERLLAIDKLDVPFSVKPGERPDELVAEWRYADARWLDHARAHHLRKVFRYTLRLDEAARTVRVFEFRAETDASAGMDGARLRFHMSRGITFFEIRRETVFGLQFRDGKLATDLAYTWRFSVDEIRAPLRDTVNKSGWRWKQLMLDVPWLTG